MANKWVAAAGLGGLAGVGLGAASTHMSHNAHAAQLISISANFLLFHSLALLGIGLLERQGAARMLTLAGGFFAAGMVLFAGGLTALASDDQFQPIWVIPTGGLLMMAGWLTLAAYGAFAAR